MTSWCVCQNCGPVRSLYRVERKDMPGVFAEIFATDEARVRSKLEQDAPFFRVGAIVQLIPVVA